MKKFLMLSALAFSLFIFAGCPPAGEPLSPQEAKIQACAEKARIPCELSARKACPGGIAGLACREAAEATCMAAAKKSCKE